MKGVRALGRSVFLQMAEGGTTMPLATDLVLHEEPDVGQVLSDGRALGRLVVRAARRFEVPLALPRMDLTLEKDLLLQGVAAGPRAVEAFHSISVTSRANQPRLPSPDCPAPTASLHRSLGPRRDDP